MEPGSSNPTSTGRRRTPNFHLHHPRNQVNSPNHGGARDDGRTEGFSTPGYSGESSRNLPSDATNSDEIITITAYGRDGKWVSLFTLDIEGIQFEAALSMGSGVSVLSSRVYDLIREKFSGDDRYNLLQINGIRIQDRFQNESKLLGIVCIPCTIFSSCGTKSVTQDINFYVVEGGAIDGVVGAPEFSVPVWDFELQQMGKPPRVPRIIGKNPSTEEHPTRSSGSNVTDETTEMECLEIEDGKNFAEICSTDGHSDEGNRSVPSDATDSDQIVTITASGDEDGKWESLFTMNIMGVTFEAVLSRESEGSVLSSRVYNLIEKKLSGDDDRYNLQQVPSVRVCDLFRREIKQLGAVRLPCSIFGNFGTKKVTQDIKFYVIEGGEIDCVVGAPAHSQDVCDLRLLPVIGKPTRSRVPRIVGRSPSTQCRTQSSGSRVTYTIVGEKILSNEKLMPFQFSLSGGTSETKEVVVCDNEELIYLVFGESDFNNSDMMDYQTSAALRQSQMQDTGPMSSPMNEDKGNPDERSSSSDRIITIIPMTSEKYPSMMKMKIANVAFEGVLSIGSGGTVLSSRIYDQIALESKDTRYKLEKPSSGIQVRDITGNRLKVLGTLDVPCTFSSTRGTNNVVEQITFLVVDGATVDCVLGEPEIYSCKMSIVLYRHLLVFNNHQSPIPIAMVGAEEDPDIAFKEEERKNLPAEHHVSPVRTVSLSLMTLTGKFPFMLKMDIVGVPFEVVLSTGSSGSALSSEVYNRIVSKTKDPRYQLQKAKNIEVRDIMGTPMKLLGILDVPCRFICARGKNSVIEMMQFLVVENLIADGVFGTPEIGSHNLSIRFEKRNSAVRFSNYKPPIEIAILET